MKKYILPIVLLVLLLMPTALAAGDIKINDFSANVTNGTIPLHTSFTGKVIGNVTTWRWDFHNRNTGATTYSSSNPSTHHDFKKPGVYNVTLNVWGLDGNDSLTKQAYVTATAVNTNNTIAVMKNTTAAGNTSTTGINGITAPARNNTKTNNNITTSIKSHMNPHWESRDKQHYLNGYNEGHRVGLINGYDKGFDLGAKGLKYTNFKYSPAQSSTSQDIGYADGYNAGYNERFLSGYNAGLNAYKRSHYSR